MRRHKRVDSWFVARYGMNLYRGCTHNCAYCDGRAESYRVEGVFERDIVIKPNAPELLARELDPRRKRKPLKPGFVLLGGGVTDSHQPLERREKTARRCLEVLADWEREPRANPAQTSLLPQCAPPGRPGHRPSPPFGVHVLTKSPLIERDLDLLQRIDQRSRAIVSMSFSTVDDELASIYEPGCRPPSERLATLRRLSAQGIATGMFLMPVIPGISDKPEQIDTAVAAAKAAGVSFVLFGGMTLKPGRQTERFLSVLGRHRPALVEPMTRLYRDSHWGVARGDYYARLGARFWQAATRHAMPPRMPAHLYADLLDENDRAVVMLEHLHYLHEQLGRDSPYGRAARSIAHLDQPLGAMTDRLQRLPGVSLATERLLLEMLQQRSCGYLQSLMPGGC